jgi:hypothetical protein
VSHQLLAACPLLGTHIVSSILALTSLFRSYLPSLLLPPGLCTSILWHASSDFYIVTSLSSFRSQTK